MKLRTSFCNRTALKKDITRFAPAWGLYSVMLFLILFIIAVDSGDYARSRSMKDSITFMSMVNLGYAFLNAQLLFGDLFNTRACNALHAMPLRRECWYVTHLIAGLLFSLVPNGIFALAMVPMLGTGALTAGYWLLAITMQYVFFFGLAVCSSLCVGNRFAMALVYGIINCFSLIIYLFISTMYEPLMEGVVISGERFRPFCPIASMMYSDGDLLKIVGTKTEYYHTRLVESISTGEGWGYLAVCAVIGVALLGVALALYRRRKLESAGDFMAVKALEPVFLVLYTLSVAAFFQLFAELLEDLDLLFLGVGFAVGYFTGRMLLMRTTRVFQPKGILWFVIFVAIFAGSLVLTALDPLGIASYVPDQEDVKEVKISTYYNPQYGEEPFLTEEDDIKLVRQIHQLVVDGQTESEDYWDMNVRDTNLSFQYKLENGATITRTYQVACDSPAGALLGQFLGRTDFILGTDDLEDLLDGLCYLYISYEPVDLRGSIDDPMRVTPQLTKGLVEAIFADCEEGRMIQHGAYHDEDVAYVGWLQLSLETEGGFSRSVSLNIYADCTNIIEYLTQHEWSFTEIDG